MKTRSTTRTFRNFVCFSLTIVIAAALCGGTALAQSTIHVPADQSTIQAGINAANTGDTVLVAPGTYIENINFHGKAITVTSSGTAPAIIDGGAKGSVVTFNSGEGPNSVLNGFTIQNGNTYYYAGGIQITNSSPTITGNLITGNHATQGLGINVYGGSPLIKYNTITANTQIGSGGGGGGGIQTGGTDTNPSSPTILANVITNNTLQGGGNGGGIHAGYFGRPTIQNNLIQGNYAYNYGGGISISSYDGATVAQNIVFDNSSGGGGGGGGVAIYASSGVVLLNNTIVGNTAYDQSSGIFVGSLSPRTITIANNIVLAAAGQTAVVCAPIWSSSSPTFSHNDYYSPTGLISSGVCDLSSPGSISADPQFVDPANDFHLKAASPAIDSGSNNVFGLPQQDYDGNPRIQDGNNACVSTVDMGAYEKSGGAVAVSFSNSSLSFPGQVIGISSSSQAVLLGNSGTGCFQFSGTQISSGFSQTNDCPATGLRGGRSCLYHVSYTPTVRGSSAGALTVMGSDGASASSPSVSLSGTGLAPPSVSLSTAQLTFAPQLIGTTSAAQTVRLTNTGDVSLNITQLLTLSPFSQSNNCPQALAGGASCSIYVAYAPSALGAQSGSLTITDDASGSPHSVSLNGTGVTPPSVSLSAKQLTFGPQPIRTTSAPQSVTLTNTGGSPLSIAGISATAPFGQSNNCPASLAGGAACTISVTFASDGAGTQTGSLTITDNASGSPHLVSLTGTATEFAISASPSSATVKHGQTAQFSITVAAVGGMFNTGVTLSCSGLPTGAKCSYSPATVIPGNTAARSTLTLSTTGSTTRGTFTISVIGKSGSLQHSVPITLLVK